MELGIQELIKEAKRKYPIGTVFKTITFTDDIFIIKGDNFIHWINSIYPKKTNTLHENNGEGLVYSNGKWAEIISYPTNYKQQTNYEIY